MPPRPRASPCPAFPSRIPCPLAPGTADSDENLQSFGVPRCDPLPCLLKFLPLVPTPPSNCVVDPEKLPASQSAAQRLEEVQCQECIYHNNGSSSTSDVRSEEEGMIRITVGGNLDTTAFLVNESGCATHCHNWRLYHQRSPYSVKCRFSRSPFGSNDNTIKDSNGEKVAANHKNVLAKVFHRSRYQRNESSSSLTVERGGGAGMLQQQKEPKAVQPGDRGSGGDVETTAVGQQR
ncbi:hypothetical protein CB1_000863002 [Camelus ferus]|nr:hypothetical protein CB1_000863002 [Camelus ferus]